MLDGVNISRVTDFMASNFQACRCRVDADSENGRNLRQRISLNFFQEKYVTVSLGKPEGSQNGALESAWAIESRHRFPDVRGPMHQQAGSNSVDGTHLPEE